MYCSLEKKDGLPINSYENDLVCPFIGLPFYLGLPFYCRHPRSGYRLVMAHLVLFCDLSHLLCLEWTYTYIFRHFPAFQPPFSDEMSKQNPDVFVLSFPSFQPGWFLVDSFHHTDWDPFLLSQNCFCFLPQENMDASGPPATTCRRLDRFLLWIHWLSKIDRPLFL